ncbi:MAG: histidinol dehydrogenase, partial [Acidobacteria bacterium]|nr:histidinol dehydrogenase [Acidobacteriota bacterium]
MLRRLDLRGAGLDLRDRLPRPATAGDGPLAAVQTILAEVRTDGDAAVRRLTAQFDGADVADPRVPAEELAAALERIPA